MDVSVIIPVYNAEKFIEKAVNSALALKEVKEVVLIEDGCPKDSLKKCRELLNKDTRIKLFQHENGVNKGAGPSRNLGIEKATYEYVAFLDSDDFFLENRFEKDKEVFQSNSDADGCYNAIGVHCYSKKAKIQFSKFKNKKPEEIDSLLTTIKPEAKPTPENCFEGLIGVIPKFGHFSLDGLTVKRESLKKMNKLFWESSMHEDSDFIIRLAYYCKLYPSQLNNAVTLRGVHEENRISNNSKENETRVLYYNELYQWILKQEVKQEATDMVYFKLKKHELYSISEKPTFLTGLFFTLKNPPIFFNDNRFITFMKLTSLKQKRFPLILKIKEKLVLLLFKNRRKKFSH